MRERKDAVWGWGWMAMKASLFPAPSLMTLRVGHGSGAHRRKKTQKERFPQIFLLWTHPFP